MYTEHDILSINQQMKRRIAAWLLPEILLLTAIALSLVWRLQWLTASLFALLCAVILFSLVNFILPVKWYRAFLGNAVRGRNRTDTVAFVALGAEAVTREGVRFYPVTMRADIPKQELDERLYYWDANLPFPGWASGETIQVTSHERMITAWHKA